MMVPAITVTWYRLWLVTVQGQVTMEVNVRLEVGVYGQDRLTECMCEHVGTCYYSNTVTWYSLEESNKL